MIHQSIHFLGGQHSKGGGEICHVCFPPGLTCPKGFKKDWLPVFELCCNMFFLGGFGGLFTFDPAWIYIPAQLPFHDSYETCEDLRCWVSDTGCGSDGPFHSKGPLRPCVILVLVFGRQDMLFTDILHNILILFQRSQLNTVTVGWSSSMISQKLLCVCVCEPMRIPPIWRRSCLPCGHLERCQSIWRIRGKRVPFTWL